MLVPVFIEAFMTKVAQGLYADVQFPTTTVPESLEVFRQIYENPNLSAAEKNLLIGKLQQRPSTPTFGPSPAGTILGAALGAPAAAVVSNLLGAPSWLQAASGLGGLLLGGRLGGSLLGPSIRDLRADPTTRGYSPWSMIQ